MFFQMYAQRERYVHVKLMLLMINHGNFESKLPFTPKFFACEIDNLTGSNRTWRIYVLYLNICPCAEV